jgi:hypothetical protein
MKKKFKKVLISVLPTGLTNLLRKWLESKQLAEWKRDGYPIPPPHVVKQKVIMEYKNQSGYRILVETGTYLGDMVEAQKKRFHKIFSIELGLDLFNDAKRRFQNDKNVTIIQGDSGKVLPEILSEINEPAIFWLDGHYSAGITARGEKECPIFEELDAIFNHSKYNHILLIDDARFFNGQGDYPSISALTDYIRSKNGEYKVEVKHDIIRYLV